MTHEELWNAIVKLAAEKICLALVWPSLPD